MTYHAGIGPRLEAVLGLGPRDPHITCDGCGTAHPVCKASGDGPYAWFLNRKAPPKWKSARTADDAGRIDTCPDCIARLKP